jgi:colicin import membrane protein
MESTPSTQLLDSLSPEQRALIQSLIAEKANEQFAKMKEDFLQEEDKRVASTPKGGAGKANGSASHRALPDSSKLTKPIPTTPATNTKKVTPPTAIVKTTSVKQRSDSKESTKSKSGGAGEAAKEAAEAKKKDEERKREEMKAKKEEAERKKKEEVEKRLKEEADKKRKL